MKLHDMEMTAAEAKKVNTPEPSAPEGPRYPWGLSMNLENDAMQKLGLTASDLPVGAEVTIVGRAKVTRAGTFEVAGGQARHDAGLQITKLGIDTSDSKDAADVLFKKKG